MSARTAALAILRGVFRLASFHADGIEQFTGTQQAFLSSLAPLVAFPLAGGMLLLLAGGGAAALSDTLATFVALLTPPVITHFLAALWQREGPWLRYAVAFNWLRWMILLAVLVYALLLGLLVAIGLRPPLALGIAQFALLAYLLALEWFVARVGLNISRGRAALVVLATELAIGVLFLGPRLVALASS